MILIALSLFVGVPQAVDWEAKTLQFEYEGRHDEAVIARIEAIRAAETEDAALLHRRELARQLEWYEGLVSTVRFDQGWWDAGGGRIAVADEAIRVYDVESGELLFAPIEQEGAEAVTLAAEAPRAVVGLTEPGGLVVFDLESGARLLERASDHGTFAISPDGRTLADAWATDSDYGVDLVDVDSGASARVSVGRPPYEGFYQMEFSPDGREIMEIYGDFVVFDVLARSATPMRPLVDLNAEDAIEQPTLRRWVDGGQKIVENGPSPMVSVWSRRGGEWACSTFVAGSYTGDIGFDPVQQAVVAVDAEDVYFIPTDTGTDGAQPLLLDDAVQFKDLNIEYSDSLCSPDGRLVAALGEYGRLRLWDIRTGRKLTREHRHRGQINAFEFLSPGRIMTRLRNGGLRVWDVGDELEGAREVHSSRPRIAYRRGRTTRCAVARTLGRATLHAKDQSPVELPLPDGEFSGVAMPSEGDRVFISGSYHGVWELSLASPQLAPRLIRDASRYWSIETSPNGRQLLQHDAFVTEVLDTSTGLSGGKLLSLAHWPHAIQDDGSVVVYHETGWVPMTKDLLPLVGHSDFKYWLEEHDAEPVTFTPLSGAGTMVIEPSDDDGRVEVRWNAATGESFAFELGEGIRGGMVAQGFLEARSSHYFVDSGEGSSDVRVFDLRTGEARRIGWEGDTLVLVEVLEDRLLLASMSEAVVFDLTDGAELLRASIAGEPSFIQLVPNRDALIVVTEEACIDGFDAVTGQRVGPRAWTGSRSLRLLWDDGTYALAEDDQDRVLEYDYESGELRAVPDGFGGDLGNVTRNADASLLAFSLKSGEVVLYDRRAGEVLFEGLPRDYLDAPREEGIHPAVESIQFDADAGVFVVLARDRRRKKDYTYPVRTFVLVLDARSGAVLGKFEPETSNWPQVLWSNDLARLAVVGYENIEVFEMESGLRTHHVPRPPSVTKGVLDPTGTRIAFFAERARHDDDGQPIPGELKVLDLNTGVFEAIECEAARTAKSGRLVASAWAVELEANDESRVVVDFATGEAEAAGERPYRGVPDGTVLAAGWLTRVTIQDGRAIPGPTRSVPHRASGATLYGEGPERFLDNDQQKVLVGVRTNTKGLEFQLVDFGPPNVAPVQGDVDDLAQEWQRRLALQVSGGEIVPMN